MRKFERGGGRLVHTATSLARATGVSSMWVHRRVDEGFLQADHTSTGQLIFTDPDIEQIANHLVERLGRDRRCAKHRRARA